MIGKFASPEKNYEVQSLDIPGERDKIKVSDIPQIESLHSRLSKVFMEEIKQNASNSDTGEIYKREAREVIELDNGYHVELPRHDGENSDGITVEDESKIKDGTDWDDEIFGNIQNLKHPQENNVSDNSDANVEKADPITEKIAQTIGTPEGIRTLMEKYPEKAELWKSQLDAIETLNDPDASPTEIRSAQAKLSILKSQIMEFAVKDALAEGGFDVEAQQRVVEGESGGTRPDVIAVNNTGYPIEVFGTSIQPGETISVECKCGVTSYMTNQLNNHIPNQLSGQEGTKVLLTTSDIKGSPDGLAARVCNKYDAKLVTLDVSVSSVEKVIKEVAGE